MTRVCAIVLQVLLTGPDAQRESFYVKQKIQNGSKRVAKTNNMEPKGNQKRAKLSQGAFENTACGTGSKSDEIGGGASRVLGEHFLYKINKKTIQKSSTNYHQQTLILMPKRCPNCIKIDARKSSYINAKTGNEEDHENHQKSCFSQW